MSIRWLPVAGLALLLFAVDQLYRILHPEVDPLRACLVGATAWVALRALEWSGLARRPALRPWLAPAGPGGLTVFASAIGSVLLIEAGWLVSRSAPSVAVHLAILALAWVSLERLRPRPG